MDAVGRGADSAGAVGSERATPQGVGGWLPGRLVTGAATGIQGSG